jgi:hypothetical protein
MDSLAAALVISTLILCTCGVEIRHREVEQNTWPFSKVPSEPEPSKSIPEILGLDTPKE